MQAKKGILPIIIISQFFCTSLWFASNSIIKELIVFFKLDISAVGNLTSTVQFGFILGTLLFAILTIADRFSPSKVFFVCATFGALFNIGILHKENTFESLLILRFLTGFSLAGIYPVGMKIASDYFDKNLGKSLGFLVGALVLGTAFPHLLKSFGQFLSWKTVILTTSAIAFLGGLFMLLFVKDGPYLKKSQKPDFKKFIIIFKNENFRNAAFGYFGHMWELYAFWTFVPFLYAYYQKLNPETDFNIAFLSFITIAIGSISCVFGGYLSERIGIKKSAKLFLFLSGICCLISPLLFYTSQEIFISFLIFWGCVVIADSPLFSTLVAQSADPAIKGTALTIVNSIGFAITIVSIQLLNYLINSDSTYIFMILAMGPILGVAQLIKTKKRL